MSNPVLEITGSVRKCCGPIGPCSGEMVIRYHAPNCPLWNDRPCNCWVLDTVRVAAHEMPVFAQCNECGYAPSNVFRKPLVRREPSES